MSGLGEGGTYRLKEQVTEVAPAPVILLEGAYSASPPLKDLIDLAVLIHAQNQARHLRTVARGDDAEFLGRWHQVWDEVEAYYFEHVRPPESFDLVILNFINGQVFMSPFHRVPDRDRRVAVPFCVRRTARTLPSNTVAGFDFLQHCVRFETNQQVGQPWIYI